MRRILVILVCALAAVPAAVAGSNLAGDGSLELKAVYGKVTIGKPFQPARGLLSGSDGQRQTDCRGPGHR